MGRKGRKKCGSCVHLNNFDVKMVRNGAQFYDDRKRTKVVDLVRSDFDAALYVGFSFGGKNSSLQAACDTPSCSHFA